MTDPTDRTAPSGPAAASTSTDFPAGTVTPFRLQVPQAELADLQHRVRSARLPGVLGDGTDETGFTTADARDLLHHWRTRFDWRAVEKGINDLDHVLVDVGATTGQHGQQVHVVRAAAERADRRAGRLPVVLVHGWPDSFLRYRHLLDPLTAAGHDVYLPSLPGFAFSDQPAGAATVEVATEAVLAALSVLGVRRFAVHGGDWGSAVAEQMAIAAPDAVAALHLSDVPWRHLFTVDRADASQAEQGFFAASDAWAAQAAYISVQATQTTTLALALADSPLGMAAWWAEKYRAWSDAPVGWDEVLTQVCLTWFTRTEHSGMRYYAAMGDSWDSQDGEEDGWGADYGTGAEADGGEDGAWIAVAAQPTAVALFPADISTPPREYAARAFSGLRRFTVMPCGGHYGALEEPALLAADITAFLADLA